MLKIGLFSKLSRVSIRMLRYYDEMGLLHPAYIDPESDYRYYREDQLPQIGWNALDILRPNAMTEGLENGSYVYFVHSFMAHPADENDLAAVTDYGTRVPAVVARGNLFGCQFHPEKSGEVGLAMLRNFAKLTEVGK